jgi:hypothetical protein
MVTKSSQFDGKRILTSGFRKSQVVDVGKQLHRGGAASVARNAKYDTGELECLKEGQVDDQLLIGVTPDAESVVANEEVCELIRSGLIQTVTSRLDQLVIDTSRGCRHSQELLSRDIERANFVLGVSFVNS